MQPTMECPKCHKEYPDNDGFGFQRCEKCGYCTHSSITEGICDLCEKVLLRDDKKPEWLLRHKLLDAIEEGMLFASRKAIPNLYDDKGHAFWKEKAVDALMKVVREACAEERRKTIDEVKVIFEKHNHEIMVTTGGAILLELDVLAQRKDAP